MVNQGCLGVGPGVVVTFHADGIGELGSLQTTGAIGPGAGETLALETTVSLQDAEVWVSVDTAGGGGVINECAEDNNLSEHVMCRDAVVAPL